MGIIRIHSGHIVKVLALLTTPQIREYVISSLYFSEQKEFAREQARLYDLRELLVVELVPGMDDICDRCRPPKKQQKCESVLESPHTIRGIAFEFKQYSITELLAFFDPEWYCAELREEAFLYG